MAPSRSGVNSSATGSTGEQPSSHGQTSPSDGAYRLAELLTDLEADDVVRAKLQLPRRATEILRHEASDLVVRRIAARAACRLDCRRP
jgi:hypothetical protein